MPLTKIGFANAFIPLSIPNKKRTSHKKGSHAFPSSFKKPRFPGAIKYAAILPRRESNLLSEVLEAGALALPIAAGGIPPFRLALPASARRSQADESILEAGEYGRKVRRPCKGLRPLRRLSSQCVYPLKKKSRPKRTFSALVCGLFRRNAFYFGVRQIAARARIQRSA